MSIFKNTTRVMAGVMAAIGLGLTAAPAEAQVNRQVWFQNDCRYPVRLFIHHQHTDGLWYSHGWYEFSGNQAMTPMNVNDYDALMHFEGWDFYAYGEVTSPGVEYFWDGDYTVNYNNVTFNVRRVSMQMREGRMYFSFSCTNL